MNWGYLDGCNYSRIHTINLHQETPRMSFAMHFVSSRVTCHRQPLVDLPRSNSPYETYPPCLGLRQTYKISWKTPIYTLCFGTQNLFLNGFLARFVSITVLATALWPKTCHFLRDYSSQNTFGIVVTEQLLLVSVDLCLNHMSISISQI